MKFCRILFYLSFQERNDRIYTYQNIRISVAVIDNLKKKKYSSVVHDEKFLKLLLLSTFTSKTLKAAKTIHELDASKLRFARGKIFEFEPLQLTAPAAVIKIN